MKKNYISPLATVVTLNTTDMFAASPGIGGNYNSSNPALSKEISIDYEQEETINGEW